MIGNGLPQFGDAPVGNGQQQFFTVIQHHFPLEFAPNREGKPDGTAAGKIQHRSSGKFVSGNGCSHLDRSVPLNGLHKIAYLLPGADVALGQQLVVGGLHGDLADLQVFRQGPLGGQFLPRGQGAV